MSDVISKDCCVNINLNELVAIRASFLEEVLTEDASETTSTEPVQEVSKSMEKYLKAIGRDEARAKK